MSKTNSIVENLSIIIPAKNEAESLKDLLPRLKELYSSAEIIVINDGSTDKTPQVCEECDVLLINHPYSKGNGAAVKSGALKASRDLLLFMDGDGQHQPYEIKNLLEMFEEGYDMVVGARESQHQANVSRLIGNTLYNRFSTWMTGHQILDLTSGFRVVRAKKFLEFLYMLPNGFSYPTTITMAFFRSGYSVGYKKVEVLNREGESHINIVKDGIKFLLIIFKVSTLYSPLKLFATIGGSMFLCGLVYYVYTYLLYDRFTNMGMFLILSSLFIFLAGLISEQVSTLFYKK